MITVPSETSDVKQLDTMTGVAPAELVTFGLPREDFAFDDVARVRVMGTPVLNAAGYTVDTGCRSKTFSALDPMPEVGVGTACIGTSGVASVIVASRQMDGLPYSWAAATDVTIGSDGMATATLSPWSTAWVGMFVTHTNIPDGALGFIGSAAAVHRDIPFRGLQVSDRVTAFPGASATFHVGYPDFGEGTEYSLAFVTGANDVATGTSAIVAHVAGHPESLLFDTQEVYLPTIKGVTADRASAERVSATWTTQPGDAALLMVSGQGRQWNLMTRADAGTARLPALPPEFSSYVPAGGATVDVVIVDDDGISGFDDARLGIGTSILDRPLRGSDRVRYVVERAP
jgi:hypothetical protein